MVKEGKLIQYREKLERTLAYDNLIDRDKLKKLVKEQILQSSKYANEGYIDNVLKKKTDELPNMLEMLRSVSDNYETLPDAVPHPSRKLKQDNDEFRVMYREGPEGSPFHTLLVEGYVDVPVDASLCISWETELYPTWDHAGKLLWAFKEVIDALWSCIGAEALAGCLLVAKANKLGCSNIVVEFDSIEVITKVQTNIIILSKLGNIMKRLKNLAGKIQTLSWSHTRRYGNNLAHAISKLPLRNAFYFWDDNFPVTIQSIALANVV